MVLGWRPAKNWDVSLKARRRVGQISFYDFLSQPKLSDDRENAGNPDLVPPQSWEFEAEVTHELGPWGKTVLNGHYYLVDDIIDIIPLKDHGQGVGNLPHATRWGLESTSTINFDPLGLKGRNSTPISVSNRTRVKDPLTGEYREISGIQRGWINLGLPPRHSAQRDRLGNRGQLRRPTAGICSSPKYNKTWEGPWFTDVYIEHKNVFGMTAQSVLSNPLTRAIIGTASTMRIGATAARSISTRMPTS